MPAANALSGPRRRAVLVGCNYASTPSASLQGCINDASCLRHLLISRFGFLDQDIVLLLDTSPYPSQWPTRANILWHASSLSSGARSGDSLFFSFSGHGAQVPDQSGVSEEKEEEFFFCSFVFFSPFFFFILRGVFYQLTFSLSFSLHPLPFPLSSLLSPLQDEADGLSETICPCDFQDTSGSGGMILDDELNFALVRPLPAGAKLHSLLDCCHSGSTLNLEFRAKARDGPIYWKQEYEWQPRTYKGSAGGLIVGISASRDKQVAADTSQLAAGGSHTGAATFTFIQSIEAYGTSLSYEALLRNMKSVLDASVNSGPSSGLAGLGLPTSLGGGGGGAAGGIMGKLNSLLSGALDAAGMSGQTPCLTSNFAFDLNTPLGI